MPTVTYTRVGREIVSENRDGIHSGYINDLAGSTIGLTDSDETLTDTYTYWPYGEEQSHSGSADIPLKFLGTYGVYTDEPSQVHIGVREYSPQAGRWMQKDWVRRDRTRYSYGLDNPTCFHDINGFEAATIGIGGGGLVGGLTGGALGTIAAGATAILAGGYAIYDLINWGLTGEAGYITGAGLGIGTAIGDAIFGNELPAPTPDELMRLCRELGLGNCDSLAIPIPQPIPIPCERTWDWPPTPPWDEWCMSICEFQCEAYRIMGDLEGFRICFQNCMQNCNRSPTIPLPPRP